MFHPAVLRHRPWSVSKLGTLDCPRSFWYRYVLLDRGTETGSESKIGSVVHNVQEHSLLGHELSEGARLDQEADKALLTEEERASAGQRMEGVKAFTERVKVWEEKNEVVDRVVEGSFAIGLDWNKCEETDKNVLVRGRIDYVGVTPRGLARVVDHKTGKKREIDYHTTQLHTYGLLTLPRYPHIKAIQAGIHYVGDPELHWLPVISAYDVVNRLRPWFVTTLNRQTTNLVQIEQGKAKAKPTPLCGWCSYKDKCPEGKEYLERRAAEAAAKKES